ncbi:MAG: DUF2252 family protein, partial [Candidatus Nanopelagicales bacterium]
MLSRAVAAPRPTAGPAFRIDAATSLHERRPDRRARREAGAARRSDVPLASHAAAPGLDDRADPLAILRTQESQREPSLVPIRYERMSADPFAFLRGAAA